MFQNSQINWFLKIICAIYINLVIEEINLKTNNNITITIQKFGSALYNTCNVFSVRKDSHDSFALNFNVTDIKNFFVLVLMFWIGTVFTCYKITESSINLNFEHETILDSNLTIVVNCIVYKYILLLPIHLYIFNNQISFYTKYIGVPKDSKCLSKRTENKISNLHFCPSSITYPIIYCIIVDEKNRYTICDYLRRINTLIWIRSHQHLQILLLIRAVFMEV
ncbi:hypothetical protein AGLY_008510 [Aphis glycines]|uniref:Uncharacterized protein n=1 Tax=Aphis glycines TaxID=307491 RepID=A0A6G0TKU0_APHGL|nr:hypothetical protein AGLY_008510 [Aphis glycines]